LAIPKRFSDSQLEELERYSADYRRSYVKPKNECPTCQGDGGYTYLGEQYKCEEDGWGHIQARAHKLYCLGHLPKEYQVLDWEAFPHLDAWQTINTFMNFWRTNRMSGKGVHIYGAGLGLGKSWCAAEVLRRALVFGSVGYFCRFQEMVGYLNMIDQEEKNYRVKKLNYAEILVIDDILAPWGGDRHRSFFEDQLEDIIRHRTSHLLPTVTTTNLTDKLFEKHYPRIYSLLSGNQIQIHLEGEDYRIAQEREILAVDEIEQNFEVAPIYYTEDDR
jgi:DNA replication protein DnaC